MKTKHSLVAAALALAASSALAQPGPGYGPGMMGGYGPGYGPGMMGGGYGALASLKLTPEQQDKIFAIQEERRAKNWGTMTQMRAEMYKLQRLFSADTLDPKAVTEQQKKVDELRMQMLKSRLEAQKQVEAVLTPEQRKQFQQFRPWWLHSAENGE